MKKLFLSAAAILVFGVASAQKEGITFGAKAGANFSNFTGDVEGTDMATSFYIGGFADISITEKFHVQPELLYSMEGADNLAVNYIKVPVMAKFYVVEGLSIQAGPYIAFKAGADDEVDDAVKSMDFGVGVGAGYELPMGLFFDARFNQGLQNISEDDSVDFKNSAIQVGLGYRF